MVKVLEREAQPRISHERSKKLIDIAKEVLPDYSILESDKYGAVLYRGNKEGVHLDIYFPTNRINVREKGGGYFEDAIRLAEAYENRGEEEFSVKPFNEKPHGS